MAEDINSPQIWQLSNISGVYCILLALVRTVPCRDDGPLSEWNRTGAILHRDEEVWIKQSLGLLLPEIVISMLLDVGLQQLAYATLLLFSDIIPSAHRTRVRELHNMSNNIDN